MTSQLIAINLNWLLWMVEFRDCVVVNSFWWQSILIYMIMQIKVGLGYFFAEVCYIFLSVDFVSYKCCAGMADKTLFRIVASKLKMTFRHQLLQLT